MNSESVTPDHIYSFPNHPGEEVQMALKRYKGKYYVDLRLWFEKEGSSDPLTPTKKGISLGAEHLPELKEGIHQLSQVYFQLSAKAPETEKAAPQTAFQRRNPQGYRSQRYNSKTPMS